MTTHKTATLKMNNVLKFSQRQYKGNSLLEFLDDYTVVDIETNGMSSHDCEILEISALRVRDGKVVDSFSSLIAPTQPIHWYITHLTGISAETVKGAPPIEQVLSAFLQFLGDDVIVGYNVNFDVNFLYDSALRNLGALLTNDFVDVLRFARKQLPHLYNHKQTTVAQYFGISIDGAHRALTDCYICNACYLKLKSDAEKDSVINE